MKWKEKFERLFEEKEDRERRNTLLKLNKFETKRYVYQNITEKKK